MITIRSAIPTDPPQITPVPPVPEVNGDVNSDGSIDIVDALCVAQHYVGLKPVKFNLAVADVNCDGKIDIVDALNIA